MRFSAKFLAYIAIAVLILSAIPMSLGEEEQGDEITEWTFMVYLDCDNNLEAAGVEDFNEMETVGSTEDVNIIVQMDRCETDGYDESNGDWTTAKRLYVTQDPDMDIINSQEIMDLGEVNMGDPQTLVNFTTWAIDNYPAEKYALVIWNHGGAFWGVCWDEDNEDDCLSMPELKCGLARIEEHLGRDLDLVGFDACLMAQFAVMYQIRNSVDIGVGSGYVEPGEGWPYEKILPRLVADPQMSPKDLGKVIADEYVASYTDREEDPDDSTAVTQAVLDLEKYDVLAYQIDILAKILSTKAGSVPTGHHMQITTARELTNSYDLGGQFFPTNIAPVDPTGYPMYDLIDLMDNLRFYIRLDTEVRDAAQAVKLAAEDAIVHFAVNPYHGNVKGANGITIYFPSGIDTQYDAKYDEVDFAIDTYWDDFLHHYYNNENAPDTPPGIFITSPVDDYEFDRAESEKLIVKGTAFDAQNELSLIEVKIDDGEWTAVGASGVWHHDAPVSHLENGEHIIYARAFDGTEYSEEDSVQISIVGESVETEESFQNVVPILGIVVLVLVGISALFILRKRKTSA